MGDYAMGLHFDEKYGRLKTYWGEEGLTLFLFLLFLTLFLAPFADSLPVRLLTSLIFSLLMVFGVLNISRHSLARFLAGIVACAAIVLRWMMHLVPSPAILRLGSMVFLVFMGILTMAILSKVFSDTGPVTGHRIRGAIAAYLLFGITWSVLYGLLDQILPGAFSNSAAGAMYSANRQATITYFSFVTLTTLGYGDITPTHDVTRMFAVMEALTGQLYPATLLARLVSLEVSHRSGHRGDSP
jgi:hypothetical protein